MAAPLDSHRSPLAQSNRPLDMPLPATVWAAVSAIAMRQWDGFSEMRFPRAVSAATGLSPGSCPLTFVLSAKLKGK